MSKLLSYSFSKFYGIWWIRVFGYGLQLRSPRAWRSFSERNGFNRNIIEIRGWRLRYLHKLK